MVELKARPLTFSRFLIRIGEVDHQPLDIGAEERHHLPLSVPLRLHVRKRFIFHLKIPRIIDNAVLQHGTRGDRSVATTSQDHVLEGKLRGVAIERIRLVKDLDRVDHVFANQQHVLRAELRGAVRTRTDGLHVPGAVAASPLLYGANTCSGIIIPLTPTKGRYQDGSTSLNVTLTV